MGFTILGTGSALPERSVSNDELSEFLDTSEGVRTISWTAPRRIQASCGTPSGSATRGTS